MKIDSTIEAGNFNVKDIADNVIYAQINKDSNQKDYQWFLCDISDIYETPFSVEIDGVFNASYPEAWKSFVAVGSYDGGEWEALNTELLPNGTIVIHCVKAAQKLQLGYFIPYTLAQHKVLSAMYSSLKYLFSHQLEATVKGNNVEIFSYGCDSANVKNNVWIISRQHSGESNTGPFMEGVAEYMDKHSDTMAVLLGKYNMHIVHNANPDGVQYGMHRTNTEGVDLNRGWLLDDNKKCPELSFIKRCMEDFPPDLFIDIHGDERIVEPYVNIDGNINKTSEADAFVTRLTALGGLEIRDNPVENRDISIGRHFVNYKYDCLCMTIETACQFQKSSVVSEKPMDYFAKASLLGFNIMKQLADNYSTL
ncbi:M14-type cytosolic carboxypeptidase [Shewanella surugensis]|uniref:M14-type cytosolic carboxypeptidase n=1 Tax=Shewanella surugensis TaxID=212020 RepID=A0ABT0LI67_9GAMM|nr:M14-type cytosolic carboxypeptidase [Shewanella surugensis]MCL1127408.1 M14-type cytosolic carboxypeptidase [Shewanella surugensis]